MTFCHNCGRELTLGDEIFCPRCGIKVQQSRTTVDNNNQSISVQHTSGDVTGAGISGSGNVIGKDIKGNIFNIYIQNLSSEQLKTIITSSTTLEVSQSYKNADNITRELHKVTETKQQTTQVLEEINKVEKEGGTEIQEIKVGELQVSKNELSLKEIILKGNEFYYNARLHFSFYYKKEYEKSIECYDKALEIDPDIAGVWYNKGNVLDDLAKYNEAIECFDRAIAIDPNYAAAWNNKGVSIYKLRYSIGSRFGDFWSPSFLKESKDIVLEKYKEAMECFDKAIVIDPNHAAGWNNKGGVYLYVFEEFNEAIESYDRAIAINPNYLDAWYGKGLSLFKLGRYNVAIECFDRAIAIDPNYAKAWWVKGQCLHGLNKHEEGSELIRRAVDLDLRMGRVPKWSRTKDLDYEPDSM